MTQRAISSKAIQKKIWDECRRIKQKEPAICYTCGQKNLKGSNRQLGHMIPKKICPMSLKYELAYLRWQCMFCNLRLGGSGALFTYNMIEEKGYEKVMAMFGLYHILKKTEKGVKPKARMQYFIDLLDEYKKTP